MQIGTATGLRSQVFIGSSPIGGTKIGGSRGLRRCFASIVSTRVRYPGPPPNYAEIAQLEEHSLGMGKVLSSILNFSTTYYENYISLAKLDKGQSLPMARILFQWW